MLKLLVSATALLLLPLASASDSPDPTPDSLGRAFGAGLVSITYTLNPTVEAGDVLPLCADTSDVPQNRSLIGSVTGDCFQPFSRTSTCSPVIVKIDIPPAAAPDEECIENIGEWVQRIISEGPGTIFIHIEKEML